MQICPAEGIIKENGERVDVVYIDYNSLEPIVHTADDRAYELRDMDKINMRFNPFAAKRK